VKIRDINLSRIEPFGTRDTAAAFGTVPKNSGRLATLCVTNGALSYRNNTCINKCATYSLNTWCCSDTVVFPQGQLSQIPTKITLQIWTKLTLNHSSLQYKLFSVKKFADYPRTCMTCMIFCLMANTLLPKSVMPVRTCSICMVCVFMHCHSYRKKLPVNVFHRISTRLLSVSETAIALRPFLFSVHPDLFGKFPKEQVKMMMQFLSF